MRETQGVLYPTTIQPFVKATDEVALLPRQLHQSHGRFKEAHMIGLIDTSKKLENTHKVF